MSTLMDQARSRVPRFAESAVDRARLTVVPRAAQKAPRVPFIALVSLLLVGGVVGLLLFNTSMQQGSFTGTALEARAATLDAKEQALALRLQTVRDPQRLAERAEKLGMVPVTHPAFIRLSDGKVLGDPAPAQPGDAMRITPLPTRKPANLTPAAVIAKPAPSVAADTSAASTDQAAAGRKKDEHQHRSGGNQR